MPDLTGQRIEPQTSRTDVTTAPTGRLVVSVGCVKPVLFTALAKNQTRHSIFASFNLAK